MNYWLDKDNISPFLVMRSWFVSNKYIIVFCPGMDSCKVLAHGLTKERASEIVHKSNRLWKKVVKNPTCVKSCSITVCEYSFFLELESDIGDRATYEM